MNDHQKFLERCHQLADESARSGNSAVGSVVVLDGVIVGEGREATKPDHDITRHAEVEAIRDALRRLGTAKLPGCALYTTHEPCILCSYAIRHYQIAWVGFETAVHPTGGFSSPYPILAATDITIWGPPPVIELLV